VASFTRIYLPCFGWVRRFFFPGVLVGPYLDFAEYRALVSQAYSPEPKDADSKKAGRTLPKGRKRAALTRMLAGLGYLGAFVVFGPRWNYSAILEGWFARQGLLTR
jgi:lysophospholipid acyltransferase